MMHLTAQYHWKSKMAGMVVSDRSTVTSLTAKLHLKRWRTPLEITGSNIIDIRVMAT